MNGKYQKFDEDFKQGAVRVVTETGKPIAQVARDLGVNEGTLGNWVAKSSVALNPGTWGDPPLPQTSQASPRCVRASTRRGSGD
ncbi:transposase [Agrococcus sp. ARC_14]|uniref:transposase n=1 Tax=Agrococcus sp. ARC_14 TaxID=2919927 RepID=UPI001F062F01|nr:transposase [Agrococcus sp. ARC_14]MCH1883221.1 transposase [Agrococcus sp. ARC_14]